jgi:peptidyl-prolyl cis-trans isomerase D
MADVKVTQSQIEQEYQTKKDTYVQPEKRDLEQLIFANEADANAARDKIEHGQTFEQVAASLGKSHADIVAGTGVPKDSLDKARGDAVFAVPDGGVTPPVKGPFGWVLIHVTKIVPGQFTSLADATPKIRKSLMDRTAVGKLADNANAYQDAISAGAEVPEAAQKSGLRSAHIVAIDADGRAPDGTMVTTPIGDNLRAQAFRAEVGEPSDPIEAKDGTTYALKVNGVTPPKPKPFAEVRDAALAAWMTEHRAQAARAKALQLSISAQRSQSLSEAASSLGENVQTSGRLTRNSQDDTFSANLVRAIFNAPPGGVVSGPRGKGEGYVIARVIGISHPNLPVSTPEFEQSKMQFSQEAASDLTYSLAKATGARLGVKTNQKVVDQAVGVGEGS